ncbi:cyclin-like protein, partial [Basidiobolus meristosporus CBS 931.73]
YETLPRLSDFMLKVIRRTNTSHSTLLIALMYLIRLKQRHPGCKGTYGSAHRLLLASIIVASKYLYDDAYYNKTWALVSNGMFTIKEINQMEFELLYFLNFRLHINTEQWNNFVRL